MWLVPRQCWVALVPQTPHPRPDTQALLRAPPICFQRLSPPGHSPHPRLPVISCPRGSRRGVSPSPLRPPSTSQPGLGVRAPFALPLDRVGVPPFPVWRWALVQQMFVNVRLCFPAALLRPGRGAGGASSRDWVLAFLCYCEHSAPSRANRHV